MQTRRKRKAGRFLAELRERSGHSAEEAGAILRRNASQMSKIENGYNMCAYAELAALLVYYGASDRERVTAETLWQDAKEDGKRIQYSSAVPPKFRTYLRHEADSALVRELQPSSIPGLLQTGEYAAAARLAAHWLVDPNVGAERATAARLERQKLLHGPEPLALHVVVDEGAIRRQVGGPVVMANQLRHLLTIGEQDNITVQVITDDAGAYGTQSGPVVILGFDDPEDPEIVYLETPNGGDWVDDRDDIAKFVALFDDASAQALPAPEAAALIRARAEELEGL
jgi:hypothetical protein